MRKLEGRSRMKEGGVGICLERQARRDHVWPLDPGDRKPLKGIEEENDMV